MNPDHRNLLDKTLSFAGGWLMSSGLTLVLENRLPPEAGLLLPIMGLGGFVAGGILLIYAVWPKQ